MPADSSFFDLLSFSWSKKTQLTPSLINGILLKIGLLTRPVSRIYGILSRHGDSFSFCN